MLKLTKKADYGLIAVKHLAVTAPRGVASSKEIADCYRIPLPLLAKTLQKLARGGILQSLAGTNGGYRLARSPQLISALEVIRAIDGPILLTSCFTDHGECDQSEHCNVRAPLRKIHEGIVHLLSTISFSVLSSENGPAMSGPAGGSLPRPMELLRL
jgi:Rrf2 family protein